MCIFEKFLRFFFVLDLQKNYVKRNIKSSCDTARYGTILSYSRRAVYAWKSKRPRATWGEKEYGKCYLFTCTYDVLQVMLYIVVCKCVTLL